MEAYLDNSATTRVCKAAADAAYSAMLDCYGNPSSLHAVGFAADKLLEKARGQVALKIGCEPEELYFTSGGTESNNIAIFGAANTLRKRGNRIVTTAIEHPSVLTPMKELEKQGFEVIYLPAGENGCVSEADLYEAVNDKTILVSMMAVNNEVGSIQPINAVRRAIKRANAPALFHCDCVQAFGKLPIKPSKYGIDLMSVSSHKVHGPKGVGGLFVRKNVRILPRTFGGGQEKQVRPGTQPMPAIAGFGAAAEELPEPRAQLEKTRALRDSFLEKVTSLGGIEVNSTKESLPYIINLSVMGIRSEPILNTLSGMGIYVSSGSACAKGHKSAVLTAMGLDDSRIDSALRISLSRDTTEEELNALLDGIKYVQENLRRS